MLAAVPAGTLLVWKNRGDAGRLIGMATFAVSLVVCFGSSGFYHAAPPGPARRPPPARLPRDLPAHRRHCDAHRGRRPARLVAAPAAAQVWLLAVVGGALRATVPLPQAFWTGLFLAMGWIGVVTYFELARRLSHRLLWPLWLGGLLYSAGAAINLVGWPDLWPGVVGRMNCSTCS